MYAYLVLVVTRKGRIVRPRPMMFRHGRNGTGLPPYFSHADQSDRCRRHTHARKVNFSFMELSTVALHSRPPAAES